MQAESPVARLSRRSLLAFSALAGIASTGVVRAADEVTVPVKGGNSARTGKQPGPYVSLGLHWSATIAQISGLDAVISQPVFSQNIILGIGAEPL